LSDAATPGLRATGARIVRVSGFCMAPGIEDGWVVLVLPANRPVEVGDLVLVETSAKPALHRVFHTFDFRGESFVVHAGDASGSPTQAPASAVLGIADCVLQPAGRTLPGIGTFDDAGRRRLATMTRRCQILAGLWRMARRTGCHRRPWTAAASARITRMLLPGR
jgi:hypothetical protein